MAQVRKIDWSKIKIKEMKNENLCVRMDSDLLQNLKDIEKTTKVSFSYAFNYVLRFGLDEAIRLKDNYKIPIKKENKKKIGTRINPDLLEGINLIQAESKCSINFLVNTLLRTGFEELLKQMEELD